MNTTERELTESNTETSAEILDAIYSLADGNEAIAHRIWANPSEEELLAIWEIVTKNGLLPAGDFCYGASGDKWAKGI